MKGIKIATLAALLAFAVVPAQANFAKTKVENYAHPTMLLNQTQKIMGNIGESTYVIGGQVFKPKHKKLFVEGKENVYVASFANNLINILKTNQKGYVFDPKAPVLRSELAVILAETFSVVDASDYKVQYSDVQEGYWAKEWIYKALDKGLMIGYPSGVFKPDQPVTKAEVFATIAQIVDTKYAKTSTPKLGNDKIEYIPTWANNATNEVVATGILNNAINKDKVVKEEYLSKEQTAFLLAELRKGIFLSKNIKLNGAVCEKLAKANPVLLNVKLNDRINAKHSNAGEKFTATTTKDVTIKGVEFKAGSKVVGEVVAVARPGYKNEGYVKVRFLTIENGEVKADFPAKISEVKAGELKNPNIVARFLGAPIEGAARIAGIAGRTAGVGVTTVGNRTEEFGDYLAGTLVETFAGKPISGVKSFGNSILTVFKGTADIVWLALSGTFGVLYEVGDEIMYVIMPSLSNSSSLNPNEEITIVF